MNALLEEVLDGNLQAVVATGLNNVSQNVFN